MKNKRITLKILGTGCSKCIDLENSVRKAVFELDVDADIEHIKDLREIASYGVMSTPALVLDDKVVSIGKTLNVREVKQILNKETL